MLVNKTANKEIEKTAKNVKSSEKPVEAVNNIKKTIKCNKCLWLAYQQDQMNDNYIDKVI